MNTADKLAEALRLAREWFRHEEAGEGPQADDVIKAADEAITAHDAEQAQEAQQAAQVGALPEPLTDDDAYRIVCEFFNQPWYRRVATEVVRATEKAHGIGATTGKEPGNV